MANYSTLKANVASVVRTNGQNAITGANLQSTLYGMIESLGKDYQLMGIATASTNPGSNIDQNIAYLATSGSSSVTFLNFLDSNNEPLVLFSNKFAVLKYNGSWSIESADLPTGGVTSSPYIYCPNIANNRAYAYSAADARNAAINAGYLSNGIILVYKKGSGLTGTWTVEIHVGGGTSQISDDEWEQIYPINMNELIGEFIRGFVNIITYSSKITFTKSSSTWTVRIPAGTSVVIDGLDYGGYNMVQAWSATCTPDLDDIGVVIFDTGTTTLSFVEASNVVLQPSQAVLCTFCFSNSKCTLKDSDFSVSIP